nr:MAG TPA: hypothetical protein [Caudoviricetes sp.]
MTTKNWYAQITVKTFIADDDGMVLDTRFKTIMVPANEISDLMDKSATRVREQIRESTNSLIDRMEMRNS